MSEDKKKRNRSVMWNYFEKIDHNYARCTLCSKLCSYMSTTTNLKRHLERCHSGKKSSDVQILVPDDDPREGLKEFITLEGEGTGESGEADESDAALREGDSDWVPPRKLARKSVSSSLKKVKPEVISSNGVDYLIYTHEQRPSVTTPTVVSSRSLINTPAPRTTPARPTSSAALDDDEFTTFAKFLSQRIRSFKDPYWQSCAINEINVALHKIEMRRYEPPRPPPRAHVAHSVQTEPMSCDHSAALATPPSPASDPLRGAPDDHIVEEIIAEDIP